MRRLLSERVELAGRGGAGARDVPFEVAETAGLLVVVEAPSGWRVDLGLFDPSGFRGWSGSARRVVRVAGADTTPGYLPGEILAGTWRVRLAPHAIPAEGGTVELSVWADVRAGAVTAPERPSPAARILPASPAADVPRPALPTFDGLRYLRGDLHLHTVHSDGVLSVAELAAWAGARGLDFAAVADHNTVSHHAEVARLTGLGGVALLPAEEVTTDDGHAVVLGVPEWVDPWAGPRAWWAAAEKWRGAMVLAHPVDGQLGWRYGSVAPGVLLEAWNGGGEPRVTPALAAMVAGLVALGGAGFVGGSDFHSPGNRRAPGTPTTWVLADEAVGPDTPAAVLAGLSEGRVTVSGSPTGPVIVPLEEGQVLVVGGEGLELVGLDGDRRAVRGSHHEIRARHQPLWLEGDGRVWAAWAPASWPAGGARRAGSAEVAGAGSESGRSEGAGGPPGSMSRPRGVA